MTDTIRIVLVDDHAILRQGLRMLIDSEADMAVVGEAKLEPERNPVARLMRRLFPMTPTLEGQRFFVRRDGILMLNVRLTLETDDGLLRLFLAPLPR